MVCGFVHNLDKEYVTIFTDKNTAKRVKVSDIEMSGRAKKGSAIIKTPKSKRYNIVRAYNSSSKNIFGIVDGDVGYLKSSDISIMDTQSTGMTFSRKNVDNIFMLSKIVDITNEKNVEIEIESTDEEIKEVTKDKEIKIAQAKVEEKPKKEKQLTMSDFFEEFKL